MDRDAETRAAIMERLKAIDLKPYQPLSLYEVGSHLVPAGFSEDELYGALVRLQNDGLIELMTGNRLQITESKST